MKVFSYSTEMFYMYIKHFLKNTVHFYESHWFCFRLLRCILDFSS